MGDATVQKRWWKDAVVYQVYPASFKDSNGDGLGDLPGIISKLDYIRDLGVDTIWICPMYDSPQVDMGYDISNYNAVYPPYGTLDDMMTLISQTHSRGMRIVMDLVVNHTSDRHAWFEESRSSKHNPKRDWYIWRPAKHDESGNRVPPNNWRSNFSQPAWTWDETTQEYYLHLFCPEQPDLNWENPDTRRAIYASAMEFWLSRGVDGFRVDTVNMYSKGDLADVPVTDPTRRDQPAGEKFCNGPRMHEFLREMNRDVLQKYGDVVTIGELGFCKSAEKALKYVSLSDPQLSMTIRFDVVDLGTGKLAGKPNFSYTPFKLSQFKNIWTDVQKSVQGTDGWSTAFIENHDQGRSVSRYANDSPEFWERSCKLMATLLATSSGTLFVYQGQEIGMINAPSSWDLDEYLDVDGRNYIDFIRDPATGEIKDLEYVKHGLQQLARDHARLPMQWDSSPYAGFSSNKPWMRVHDRYKEINAAKQEQDPASVLCYWREMLKLRKQFPDLFVYGQVEMLDAGNEETFVFVKSEPGKSDAAPVALVALNFTARDREFAAPQRALDREVKLLATNYSTNTDPRSWKLRPWESKVLLIT